mgnify:CR=1 FL=1
MDKLTAMDNTKLFVCDDQMEDATTLEKLHELNDFNEIELKELNSLGIGETCNLFLHR